MGRDRSCVDPSEWPSAEEVEADIDARTGANRDCPDREVFAKRYVREVLAESVDHERRAFVAWSVYRVWEVERKTQEQSFLEHFGCGRRTLYNWKKSLGLVCDRRSKAISSALSKRAECATACTSGNDQIPEFLFEQPHLRKFGEVAKGWLRDEMTVDELLDAKSALRRVGAELERRIRARGAGASL